MIGLEPLLGGTRGRADGPPIVPGLPTAPRPARPPGGAAKTSLPPGPREPFLLGAWRVLREGESRLDDLRERYGDAFTLRVPTLGPVVALTDPELVKQVLTADPAVLEAGAGNRPLGIVVGRRSVMLLDGAEHLDMRKLLLPQLHGTRLERYSETIEELAEEMVDRWPLQRQFPVLPHMQALTLEVIMRVVFGVEDERRLQELRPTLRRLLALVGSRGIYLRYPLRRLGGISTWRSFQRVMADTDRLLGEEIAARRADPDLEQRDDVLALLLGARTEGGEPLSDAALRDQLVTLLVAGHETTATGLAWALERLTRHPEALRRLTEEATDATGEQYAIAVAHETLRTRPPVPIVARRLSRPFELAGYRLPKGTRVVPLIVTIHRRPDLYPDPRAFRPERFLEARPATYSWLAFGGGIRRCIGASFATLEMRIVLHTVARRLQLAAAERRSEPPDVRAIFYTPRYGAQISIERRLPPGRSPQRLTPPKQYPLLTERSSSLQEEESAMEAGTAEHATGPTVEDTPVAASGQAPAARTIADVIPHAVATYGTCVAVRYKRDGAWQDVTYAEMAEHRAGDRARADRPRHRARRARVHPRQHPTGVVLRGHGGDRRRRGRGADLPDQLARGVPVGDLRLRGVRDRVRERRAARQDRRHPRPAAAPAHGDRDRPAGRPTPEGTAVGTDAPASTAAGGPSPDGAGGPATAIPLETLRARGRALAAGDARRSSSAAAPRSARRTRSPSSTPPAPPARRRAACSRTATTARSIDMVRDGRRRSSDDEVIYLYLPLAHSYALLIQLARSTSAARSPTSAATPSRSSPSCWRSNRPTCRRCRACSRRSTRSPTARSRRSRREEREQAEEAIALGVKVRDMIARGEAVPEELREPFEEADEELFKNVRAIFGGDVRQADQRRRADRAARSSNSSSPAGCRCSRATA